jgi:hypothetical protein
MYGDDGTDDYVHPTEELEAIIELHVRPDRHPQTVSGLLDVREAAWAILSSKAFAQAERDATDKALRDAAKNLPQSWSVETRNLVSAHLIKTADDLDTEAQWKTLTGEKS